VDSDGILVSGQRVPAGTVIWGAGVVASPAGRWLGAETDKSGKIMVEPDLSVRDHPIQEGKYVADVIRRRVAGRAQPEPFWYWDKGDLAIVGRTYAVADLRFSRFAGFAAWVIWAVVHIYFLIGFANRLVVLLQWGLDFLTKRRRVRVLSVEPSSAQNAIDPAA